MYINSSFKKKIRIIYHKIRIKYRQLKYWFKFAGKDIQVSPSTWIAKHSIIRNDCNGSVKIGNNCEIHDFSMILTYGGNIIIGDNCSLNSFSIIYGHGGVKIGSGVRIAAHTVIIPANHIPGTNEVPLYKSGIFTKGISIEDNVWIGASCQILDGISIGENSIIGAGSIVTKSIPANCTAFGNPAKVIKYRNT